MNVSCKLIKSSEYDYCSSSFSVHISAWVQFVSKSNQYPSFKEFSSFEKRSLSTDDSKVWNALVRKFRIFIFWWHRNNRCLSALTFSPLAGRQRRSGDRHPLDRVNQCYFWLSLARLARLTSSFQIIPFPYYRIWGPLEDGPAHPVSLTNWASNILQVVRNRRPITFYLLNGSDCRTNQLKNFL